MISTYISPNLTIYQSFKDIRNENPFGRYNLLFGEERLEVKDLFSHSRFIVLGEPGYGKTELLRKIVEEASTQNHEAIMLDLKSLDLTMGLANNISKMIKRPDSIKTNEFKLINSENVIVCLDALDEVTTSNLSIVIDKIKDFLADFADIKIYLSCRQLYYESYQNSFNGYNCKILVIECFYQEQIVKYLKGNNLNETVIDIVLKNFIQNSGFISVIQTPRYLSLLVSYISERGVNEIDKLTRCQLFEYFIYSKLNKEKEILKNVDINLIKRVLETLALTMSIYQTRKITKDELMTFFDDVKNDLKINILSQITIDEFVQKSILKNNIDSIEFDNSEFQEYLAAKELSRFKKLQQSVFDLAVNSQIREVYPSWFNVLSYLIEMNVSLLDDILSFGMKGKKTIIEGYFKLITGVNVNLLSKITQDKIFKEVFEYYQTNKLSLYGHFCKNLSYYYTENNLDNIKKYFILDKSKYEEHIVIRNIFTIVFEIIERGYFNSNEIKFWTDKLISILEDPKVKIELKEQILFTTKHLKERKILTLMQKFPYKLDKDLLQSIISYASNIDVNDPITLNFIIEGIKSRSSLSIYHLTRMSSPYIIKSFFKKLNFDLNLIHKFHESASGNNGKYLNEFVSSIDKIIDQELINLIKKFIFKSYNRKIHWRQHSKVIKPLAELISKNDPNFIFELINKFNQAKGEFFEYQISEVFSYSINEKQIPKFIEEVKNKLPTLSRLAFETFYRLKHSKEIRYKELFKSGRQFFKKDYGKADRNALKNTRREDEMKKEEFETFSAILNVSTENSYFPDLFSLYAVHHDTIEQFISKDEKEKFKKLNNLFLSSHNPLNSGLVFKTDTQYSVNSYILDYGEALECALLLSLNVINFRQNIINYIPFAYSNNLETIFALVGNISADEIKPVLDVYQQKSDDLWRFMPENILQVVERYNLKEAENILEDFILSNSFRASSNFYKIKALNLLNSIKNSKEYLNDLFHSGISHAENFIAIEANSILISYYQDINAIKWRMNQINKRVFENVKAKDGNVSAEENELRNKNFAKPLMEVKDDKFIKIYLKLFKESFKVQKKKENYWRYANYMREIVLAYFFNLREYKLFEYFEELEKLCSKFEDLDHYGYILSTISNLKNQYIDYIGKPTNISECIQKYNKIKSGQYIEINNSRELLDKINFLIRSDLNNWILGEGIKIIEAVKAKERLSETELQKLLKTQLEIILLRKGFRSEEINIYREAQALNDKRPDFIIAYGFVTPIVIELKLSDHADLNTKDLANSKSYESLKFYLNNFNVDYAIFLIYQNQSLSKGKWLEFLKKIEVEYSKIPHVVVTGI